ncbi:hypothetical protein [Nocardioides dongxiaopingii]|uniref:hypothetical protein n=1 Tax=Nocardioides dongxiaopingii TaxID=2576036 RepID=UPI0010C76BAF|nr:hypothetical protein [Nocardioides dongxiaopingii]
MTVLAGPRPVPSPTTAVVLPGMAPSTWHAVGAYMTTSAEVADAAEVADRAVGYDVRAAFRDQPSGSYGAPAQLAFLLNTVALGRVVLEQGTDPDDVVLVPSSFGAWAACVLSGVADLADVARAVQTLATREQELGESSLAGLATVFFCRLDGDAVAGLVGWMRAGGCHAEPALDLDHDLVGYTVDDVPRMRAGVEARGGIWLHEMRPAVHSVRSAELADLAHDLVSGWDLGPARFPVLSDHDGTSTVEPGVLVGHVAAQYVRTVDWPRTVSRLVSTGIERAVVAGPASLFNKVLRRHLPTVAVTPDDDGRVVSRSLRRSEPR